MQMKRRSILAALLLTALPAVAQQKVKSVRLYVFDCGRLKSGNPAPLLERGVTTTDMSVEAFLVVHPRGTRLPGRRGAVYTKALRLVVLLGRSSRVGVGPARPAWRAALRLVCQDAR